ncbi:MAG: transcription elongation factor GreA [Patescibacteria group bacterium]
MVIKKIQCTKKGFIALEKELKELNDVKKPLILEKLQRARGMGDLAENNAYTTARDELNMIDGRIMELTDIINNAEIIDETVLKNEVTIGAHITVEINNAVEDLHVVGEFESDPLNKKVSHTSPIGQALLGKKIGDVVEIEIPSGKIRYKILSIK